MKTLSLLQKRILGRWEIKFIFHSFFISLFLLPLFGCGGASPQATIPAPVSQLIAISAPVGGMVTVTGSAGAVEGGATVDIINATQFALTQNSFSWFIKSAFAQQIYDVELIANDDGSFTANISAEVGDIIQVTQTVDGITSQPTSFQVESSTSPSSSLPPNFTIKPPSYE